MRRIEGEETDDVERKAEERGEDWQIKLSCFCDLILKIFLFFFFFFCKCANVPYAMPQPARVRYVSLVSGPTLLSL